MRRIFCDVDGTLTVHDAKGSDPNWETINKLKDLMAKGVPVILWSGRSRRYAERFAKKYELNVEMCLSKPMMFVDDNPTLRPTSRMPTLSPQEFLDHDFSKLFLDLSDELD